MSSSRSQGDSVDPSYGNSPMRKSWEDLDQERMSGRAEGLEYASDKFVMRAITNERALVRCQLTRLVQQFCAQHIAMVNRPHPVLTTTRPLDWDAVSHPGPWPDGYEDDPSLRLRWRMREFITKNGKAKPVWSWEYRDRPNPPQRGMLLRSKMTSSAEIASYLKWFSVIEGTWQRYLRVGETGAQFIKLISQHIREGEDGFIESVLSEGPVMKRTLLSGSKVMASLFPPETGTEDGDDLVGFDGDEPPALDSDATLKWD